MSQRSDSGALSNDSRESKVFKNESGRTQQNDDDDDRIGSPLNRPAIRN